MDKPEIDLSIIVVAWNVRELVDECFQAIRASSDTLRKEILFVDNASADGTADFVEKNYPEVVLLRSDTNLGFIRANNLAYKRARGKYILMLNSDAFVSRTALQESVDFLESHPEAGVLGAHLIGRDGSLQPSTRNFPTPLRLFLNQVGLNGRLPNVKPLDYLDWDHATPRECDWVIGCYLLTRKDLIDRMGFFLREDFFMYNDDNDLCFRIKGLGYKVFYYPVDVVHVGGATAAKILNTAKKNPMVEKWQIESQAIYFRKNHHLGTVFFNLILLLLNDSLKGAKRLLVKKEGSTAREIFEHMKLVLSVYRRTGFGKKAIH